MDIPPLVHYLRSASERELSVVRRVRTSLQAVLFWSGIALPVLYLPLLVTGPDSATEMTALLLLLGLHAFSLLVSHSYNPG